MLRAATGASALDYLTQPKGRAEEYGILILNIRGVRDMVTDINTKQKRWK
jgi:hypothetical protein